MMNNEGQSAKVLLIEDDAFLLGMYVTKLELEHLQPLVATDGDTGLRLAKQEKPDLILLDIILPGMDGFQVLEDLKADPATKGIPVILLTNLGQERDVERGMALGASDYLVKAHYMPSEVVEKVVKMINDTKTMRALSL